MSISAEAELILTTARTTMEPSAVERLKSLVLGTIDWSWVLDLAVKNCVGPLLYKSLRTHVPHAVPPPVMEKLQKDYHQNIARNLELERQLTALLVHFQKHGVAAIPYKGPTLARAAYGDLALRTSGDLDIFVRKQDIEKATALMTSVGYQPQFAFDPGQMAAYVDKFYELSFTGAAKAPVELHWEIYADHFVFPLASLSIWHDQAENRSQPQYRSISLENLLLILCVHGTQHCWGRFAWICDIAELLRRFRDLRWESLLEIATKTGGRRMLCIGLSLARELVDAPVSDEVLHSIDKDRVVKQLVKIIRCRLFEHAKSAPGTLDTCLFYMKSRERFRDKARFFVRTFSRPVPGEWDQLILNNVFARFRCVTRHVVKGLSYGLDLVRQTTVSSLSCSSAALRNGTKVR
ncbi:MAG: nucleotidyltransferase family protein [Syntrophales bacterium LBB04]|nr:nucleotidyltransferase family protein [Syntrophales bacterium LBB04]